MTERNPAMPSTSHSEEFVELVISGQRRLYAYILTLVPDANEASDVLQQTNMTLWRDAHRYVSGTSFINWAFRIAYFMVLEHRKKIKRNRARFCDVLIENLAGESEEYAKEEDARIAAMRACIEQLPARQQELVRRRYAEGEMVSSIATSLDQRANALANSLFRIRSALWNCVQKRLSAEVSE